MILFQSTETLPDPIPSNVSLGIDAGIDNFMALSKVELIKIPKFLINQLKNKIKGSKCLFIKQSIDSVIGNFINQILPFVAWKTGKYFEKVNKDFTSQECPICRLFTGKKLLQQRIDKC